MAFLMTCQQRKKQILYTFLKRCKTFQEKKTRKKCLLCTGIAESILGTVRTMGGNAGLVSGSILSIGGDGECVELRLILCRTGLDIFRLLAPCGSFTTVIR